MTPDDLATKCPVYLYAALPGPVGWRVVTKGAYVNQVRVGWCHVLFVRDPIEATRLGRLHSGR